MTIFKCLWRCFTESFVWRLFKLNVFEVCYKQINHTICPHGHWGRHHLDTPADVFSPNRTFGLLLKWLDHHRLRYLCSIQIYGPQTLVFKGADNTFNAEGSCGTLRILHSVIKRKYHGMLVIGVCIIMPIPMWPMLSRTCCSLCAAKFLTISYTAQTFPYVTSTCSAPLSKVVRCCIFRLDTSIKHAVVQWF